MTPGSRIERFMRQMVSSYVLAAAGLAFGLITTPLALHYLSKPEFALWALLAQVQTYMLLIDMGMSPAISRLLIDHKDQPEDGQYGALIRLAALISAAQGAAVFAIGCATAPWMADALRIPPEQRPLFVSLIRYQSALTGAGCAMPIVRHVLYAHHRNDLINYTNAAMFAVSLLAMWVALDRGCGAYSVLWSNIPLSIAGPLAMLAMCLRLRLFPAFDRLSRPTWRQFLGVFAYGRDVFLVHVGSLLIIASQNFVLSNRVGLEMVAAWAVGTRAYAVLARLLYQVYDQAAPALSEMMVRREHDRLRRRYADLLGLSLSLAGVAAVVFAACNSLFVALWTSGKIAWPARNDVLLAAWMLPLVYLHMACGFVLLTKKVGAMRFVYFAEGLTVVAAGALLVTRGGLPAMIAVSICCSLAFSARYGLRHGNRYFGCRFPQMEREWAVPLAKTLAAMLPAAVAVWWATRGLPAAAALAVNAGVLAAAGAFVFLRFGVPPGLRPEVLARLPAPLRACLR